MNGLPFPAYLGKYNAVSSSEASAYIGDDALVAAIAAGDTRAFGEVMEANMQDVFRFSYSLLGDAARAEDATQETFLRLWSRSGQWQPKGRLKSWLLRVAHNLCIDELRRKRGHVNVDDVTPVLADTAAGPREVFVQAQSADIVRKALFELPERQRAALVLVHYHDRTNAEAAEIMGISIDALESLLARGKRELKDRLKAKKGILLGD